ncbi:MAG TPA: MBOAT family O-acyltransferase [Bacteroidia bacterium]
MLFNSLEFAVFLPIVFLLYWYVFNKNLKLQNLLLLVSSYIFYGWWDWRFLTMMAFTTLIDYWVGIGLMNNNNKTQRKVLLFTSVILNLGLLGFFKYYNFFIESFSAAFTFFGQPFNVSTLNIVLPVGISFYTFQTMSYAIDVYQEKLKPTKDIVSFFSFVSFFPQLVAGPIERASNLLPQFYVERKFDMQKAIDGSRQMLWGLFKKIVIADNCAVYVNDIFGNYEAYNGITLLIGAIFFTIQIYGDFSGYSDIAIGCARLFGFNLMQNFAYPFFSRDMPELWRRWHISLTSWFQDYVYFPLGGSRGSKWMRVRNTFIVFILSGLWHGANFTYLFWGFIFAVYLLPNLLSDKKVKKTKVVAEGRMFPNITEVFQMLTTFILVVLITIFFRVRDMSEGMDFLGEIFSGSILALPEVFPIKMFSLIAIMFIAEWLQRDKLHALEIGNMKIPAVLRYSIYYGVIAIILLMGGSQQDFIYFQF